MNNVLSSTTDQFALIDTEKPRVKKIMALQVWEDLIDKANKIYDNGQHQQALKFYQNGLEHLFIHKNVCLISDPESYISAVTVNYLNIADNHIALQQHKKATTSFEEALLFAITLYNQHPNNQPALIAADKAVRHIILERAHLLKTHSTLCSSSSTDQFETLLNQWAGMESSPLYH